MKIRHIAAAMAATLVVAVPTAAFAGGSPYIVSVGGSAVGASGHPITASSTGAVQVSARNLSSTVVNMNCTWAAMTGTVTSGTAVNPVLSFPALATSFTGCSVPGGPATGTRLSPSHFVGTGTNATTSIETVAGHLSVHATFSVTANPNVCSFTIDGHARASFDEATQRLILNESGYTGNLVVTSVRGCLGRLQVGNPVNLITALDVLSPDGLIDLS